MKKLIIVLATLAIIASVGVMKAEAADTDTITVTVTLRNISVSVTPETWPLSTMVPGTTSAAQSCTATNDGNVTENFTIKVSTSSPGGWTPDTTAGEGKFVMTLDETTPLTEIAIPLALSGITAGSSDGFTLTFTAPTASATYDTNDYTQQSITVTVSASV